jgi:hypothetical protein
VTTEPGTAREAAERNAQAIMTGNLSQVMADITPEALAQMMQLGAQAGAMSPAAMPSIQGYDIAELGEAGGGQLFHVAFRSAIGRATIATTWKQIMGQWKIAAVALVSVEPVVEAGE